MSDLSICYPAKQNVTKMSNESTICLLIMKIGNYKSRKMCSKIFYQKYLKFTQDSLILEYLSISTLTFSAKWISLGSLQTKNNEFLKRVQMKYYDRL